MELTAGDRRDALDGDEPGRVTTATTLAGKVEELEHLGDVDEPADWTAGGRRTNTGVDQKTVRQTGTGNTFDRTLLVTVLSSWWLVTTGGESWTAVCQEGRSRATRGGVTRWPDT